MMYIRGLIALLLLISSAVFSQGHPLDTLPANTWYQVPSSAVSSVAYSPVPPSNTQNMRFLVESGGSYDTKRDRMIVWGGGHADYAGNEIYVFDIQTLTWTRVNNPTTIYDSSGTIESSGYYPDANGNPDFQQPRSRHSYWYQLYVPPIDRYCSVGAIFTYPNARTANNVDCFNFDTELWERKANALTTGTLATAIYDPITQHVFVHGTFWNSDGYLAEWNPVTDVSVARSVAMDMADASGSMEKASPAIDTRRHQLVYIGGTTWHKLMVYDLNKTGMLVPQDKTSQMSGDLTPLQNRRGGFAYDPVNDRFVFWSGELNHAPCDIYVIHPETWVSTKVTLGGATCPNEPVLFGDGIQSNGVYGRFAYIPTKQAFILINNRIADNVFFFKLGASTPPASPPGQANAFAGAEGFGSQTVGGRGGPVLIVSNTNASGPGSLREALETNGPRIIVFRVSGVINLGGADIFLEEEDSYMTVLGQSSPAGITITNGSIQSYQENLHDVIWRFLRFRMQASDPFSFNPAYNVIVDHSDFSGGDDEVFDFTHSHDWTLSWSTVTNSALAVGCDHCGHLIAYAPTTNITLHHNFSAHHRNRCGAQFHWSEADPTDEANIEITNNVVYDCTFQGIWRTDSVLLGDTFWNLIGNYAKRGPNSHGTVGQSMMFQIFNGDNGVATVYQSDNQYPSESLWSPSSDPDFVSARISTFPPVTASSSANAFNEVLAWSGSWPRDAMATRTVNDAINGTGVIGKVDDVLNTSNPTPPTDADLDGIADSWEITHGLSPSNPNDSKELHVSGYANVEVYLNEVAATLLSQTAPPAPTNLTFRLK